MQVKNYSLTGIVNPTLKVMGTYENNLDLLLIGDDKKLNYEIDKNEKNKTFEIVAFVKNIKKICLIDKNNNQEIIRLKNSKFKRIIIKLKTLFLDIFKSEIYFPHDFIRIHYIKITGTIIEFVGTITQKDYTFYLTTSNTKVKLQANIFDDSFIIRQKIDQKIRKMDLIVEIDKQEYVVATIKNRFCKRFINHIKSIFTKFYTIYPNKNIDYMGISLEGVLHPQLIVHGYIKSKTKKISFKWNQENLEYKSIPTSSEKEFYYLINLSNKHKKVDMFLNSELVLIINNRRFIRLVHKITNTIKRFFSKIYNIAYVLYRGIRVAWKQYHFLIPPSLWKKYWIEFINKIKGVSNSSLFHPDSIKEYNIWLKKNEIEEPTVVLSYHPKISLIIPVYNVARKYLKECINSILNQSYQNFEICLVDDASTNEETIKTLKELSKLDARIKLKFRQENGHISRASNDAIKMSSGEFIGLVDNDDVLAPNALYEVVKVLNDNKELDFIYSDEDKINMDNVRCYPHFKPDFSPDTLMSANYICHFSVLRKKIVEQVGCFEVGLEGAQDHDLFLKVTEVTDKIYHIPKILYHWRMIEGSTAASPNNKSYANNKGKISVENALKRRNLDGEVIVDKSGYYIVNYKVKKEPLISIIIPTRDYSNILENCLKSIYKKTTYQNFEIIVVNNNSVEKKTYQLFEKYKQKYTNFNVMDANMEFNYSKINNLAVQKAKGEYIVLLNNDTEIITPNWLEIMVGYASLDHIGAVGAKLFYPDNTIQHAGVVLGIGGIAQHTFVGANRNENGLYGRLRAPYNYSAVTAACLMVKKSKFNEVGGLEEELKVAFNDVDFNIKLVQKGYYNIELPQVELYHHESKSRGYDTTTEKYQRFLSEHDFMNKKWKSILENDPMYNKNFSMQSSFYLDKK